MTDTNDEIRLSRDVTLVLLDMLVRAGPDGAMRPIVPGEQIALWQLEGALESLLPEPFLPNYRQLLDEARRRLRELGGDTAPTLRPFVVFVDVDDTLVRSSGSKRIPIAEVVSRVRELHGTGAELHCWSSGGARYAYESAVEIGIDDCFSAFLAKPHVMIDDQPPSEWRNMVCLHPNEASSMSATEIRAVGGQSSG